MLNFIKKHTWVLILVLVLILVPQSLNIQSELNMRTLITGVAVDKDGEEFEVTAQIVKPKVGGSSPSGNAELDFVSAKAKTISEALNKIAYLLGKTAGLSHINFILVGKDLASSDEMQGTLDYFLRNTKIISSALVIIAPNKAKDELNKTSGLETTNAVGLQKLYAYKETSMNGVAKKLQDFVNDAYTKSKSSIVSGFSIQKEGEETTGATTGGASTEGDSIGGVSADSQSEGEGSGGGSSGGSDSSSGSGNKARISYDNPLYLFSNNQLKTVLTDADELLGIYLLNGTASDGVVSVEDVNSEFFENAKLGLSLRNKKVKYKAYIDNAGIKNLEITLSVGKTEITEIDSKNISQNLFESDRTYLSDSVKNAITKKFTEAISKAINKAHESGVDVLNIADRLYRRYGKEFGDWLDGNQNFEWLKSVKITLNVQIKNIK